MCCASVKNDGLCQSVKCRRGAPPPFTALVMSWKKWQKKTCTAIGAWKCNFTAFCQTTDRPTNRLTDWRTDLSIGKLHFKKMIATVQKTRPEDMTMQDHVACVTWREGWAREWGKRSIPPPLLNRVCTNSVTQLGLTRLLGVWQSNHNYLPPVVAYWGLADGRKDQKKRRFSSPIPIVWIAKFIITW